MNPSSQPENQLDNDKDLNNILANLAWSGKYFDSGQEVLNAFAVKEAKDLIDQYTQSKLKAFAGDMEEAIGEDEYPDQHFPTVLQGENIEKYDKVTARDRLRAELRQALKAIKEKYQL